MTQIADQPKASPRGGRTVIHLVPHTHWDREWYLPFQVFRLRLVTLIDLLLDRMAEQPTLTFTLDGQTATVDDYLEIRPERDADIRRAVADGRMALGPWRILMDEFLVSGETLIRNLEMGWRRATELGRAMPVGYLPDMFGHVAQMPQILRRAGIGQAVVWRGVSSAVTGHRFAWSSPDGSTVRTEYLVRGYGSASHLFVGGRPAEKIAAYRELWRSVYGDHSMLAMYGSDHTVPDATLAAVVRAFNDASDHVEVRMETLADYLEGFAAEARAIAAGDLPDGVTRWTGELRAATRANLLPNVTSARIDLKIACARAERLLERYAEPLHALHGAAAGLAWPGTELELAWRQVVECSAHDSICGCSADPVVRQVLVRLGEAAQIGEALANAVARGVAAAVPVGSVAVLNPSPVERADLVEVELAVPDAWTAVDLLLPGGRRVPTQERTRKAPHVFEIAMPGREVVDWIRRRLYGREVYQHQWNGWHEADDVRTIVLEVDDEPDPVWLDVDVLLDGIALAVATEPGEVWQVRVEARARRTVAAVVTDVPALGWATLTPVEAGAASNGAFDPVRVGVGGRELANGLVDVRIEDDGTLTIVGGGAVELRGVGRIVDGGDAGDSYNYAPPGDDVLVDHSVAVETSVLEGGPVVSRLAVDRRYTWPVGLAGTPRRREAGTVDTVVRTEIELRAGEPFVRLRVAFDNRSREHRVRFHVPVGAAVERSAAEGQFGVADRDNVIEAGHGEHPTPTFPARGWVAAGAAAVLLDHVLEYELLTAEAGDTAGSELALTLLRSIDRISRNDNPWRDEPAGPQTPIPEAELLGPWSIGFAILPIAGAWHESPVLEAAEAYQHPFLTAPGRLPWDGASPIAADAPPAPTEASGLRLGGRGVVLSALRRIGDELEVRVVAEHPDPAPAVLEGAFVAAREVDLLGRGVAELPIVAPGRLELPIGPWEIRTLRVRPGS